MAAPKHNEFWKFRAKHGRDKIFENPKTLLESAIEYFEWVNANPFPQADWVGGAGKKVTRYKPIPFSLSGLCSYLGVNKHYFNDFKAREEKKAEATSKDFTEVILYIEEVIFTNQFNGAAIGIYNGNIISAALGLVNKTSTDLTTKGQPINKPIDLSNLSLSELETLQELQEKCKQPQV